MTATHLRRRLAPLVLASLAPSCAAPENRTVLVTDETLVRMERDLDRAVEESRSRPCPRPVLRGAPLPGSADGDQDRALGHGAPRVAACLAYVRAKVAHIDAALAGRSDAFRPGVRDVLPKCEALYRALARAVRHGEACSPWRIGRGAGARLGGLLQVARAVAVKVRLDAATGRLPEALEAALDALRFVQDAARGLGTPVAAGTQGSRAYRIIVREAVLPALARAGWRSPTPAAVVVPLVDQLTRSEPTFGALLDGERRFVARHRFQPALRGAPTAVPWTGQARFVPRRQDAAVQWAVADWFLARLAEACPEPASVEACRAGLRAVEGVVADARRDPGRVFDSGVASRVRGLAAERVRELLAGCDARTYLQSLRIHADRLKHLADLRAALASWSRPGHPEPPTK